MRLLASHVCTCLPDVLIRENIAEPAKVPVYFITSRLILDQTLHVSQIFYFTFIREHGSVSLCRDGQKTNGGYNASIRVAR